MVAYKNNKKYKDILSTAKRLFWKHGIRRVTIEELCREANVSKMTFYKFFKNKNALAEQLLKDIINENNKKYRNIMDQNIPYPEKVKQTIVLKHESSQNMSEEFIKDIYQGKYAGLTKILNDSREKIREEIAEDLRRAQMDGWIRKDLKIDFILFMMDDIGERLFNDRLVSMYPDKHDLIMELTSFFFYGVIGDKD